MEALVSIIVPVYNLEGYVDICIKSLVNQTYQNIEILCIDDGSTDKSAEVIKSFAQKDDRVVYVYKENGGVSSARNLGLDMFKGEYVMFVDGDDYLHPQAVEIFLNSLIVSCCSFSVSGINEIKSQLTCFDKFNDDSFSVLSVNEFFESVESICLMSSCGKMYSRDFILRKRFMDNVFRAEDTIFFFGVLRDDAEVCYINKMLYFYYHRADSATRTGYCGNMLPTLDGFSSLAYELFEKNSIVVLAQLMLYMFKYMFVLRTLCIGTNSETEALKKYKHIGDQWIRFIFFSDYLDTKKKFFLILFYYSRYLYELARLIQDPTMLDFYKNRRKQKGKSQKD